MDKIYNVQYVDAYYTHTKTIGKTKLSLHNAHGYVEENNGNIIIVFIRKKNVSIRNTIETRENIVKGLVIPNTALVSVVTSPKASIIKNVILGTQVTVTWRDIVYVANLPRYDCSVLRTDGHLFRIEKDHIVLKTPKTVRIYPSPIKNHPEGDIPTYLIIPISFILNIEITK